MATLLNQFGEDLKKRKNTLVESLTSSANQMVRSSALGKANASNVNKAQAKQAANSGSNNTSAAKTQNSSSLRTIANLAKGTTNAPVQMKSSSLGLSTIKSPSLSTNKTTLGSSSQKTPALKTISATTTLSTIPEVTATAEQSKAQAKTTANQTVNTEDEGWKKYYDEEFKKASDSQNIFQRLLDGGSASRLAETNARNKYAQELLRKAYDEDGNLKSQTYADQAKQTADTNMQVANNYSEMEKAKSRKIGASADSDYYWDSDKSLLENLGNRAKATANVIRNANVGDMILGADDSQKTDVSDAGKFLLNLLPGMATAPIQGGTNLTEAITGKGTDSTTGKERELNTAERLGRGASGAIDAAGVFFGGSGELVESLGKQLAKSGAKELGEQVAKRTGKEIAKSYLKSMAQEGAEEGVQQAAEFFGNGGELIKDGKLDADSLKQLAGETAQAAALGAVGGGIFKAGSDLINAASNRAAQSRQSAANSNISNAEISAESQASAPTDVKSTARATTDTNTEINGNTDLDTNTTQTTEDVASGNVRSTTDTSVNTSTDEQARAQQVSDKIAQLTEQARRNQREVSSTAAGRVDDSVAQMAQNDMAAQELAKQINQAAEPDFQTTGSVNIVQRLKDFIATLKGQPDLQRVFVTPDGRKISISNLENELEKIELANQTVIEGGAPDGGDLVKTDYNLPNDLSVSEIGKRIKDTISSRFLGNTYAIGNTRSDARVTGRTRNELGYKQRKMSISDFNKKGSMIGNYDELLKNLRDAHRVPNYKSDQKPNVDHYISGRVPVELADGNIYYPRIDMEVNKNGDIIGYDIADIIEFPGGQTYSAFSGGQPRVEPRNSATANIAQNDGVVNQDFVNEPTAQQSNRQTPSSTPSTDAITEIANTSRPEEGEAAPTGKRKRSQTIENIRNNGNFTEEARNAVEAQEYTVLENNEVVDQAKQKIAKEGLDKAATRITNHLAQSKKMGKGKISNSDYAEALVALQELGQRTDDASLQQFNLLAQEIGKHSRSNAQQLQLNRIMQNQTPEGMRKNAVNNLSRADVAITPEVSKTLKAMTDDIEKYRAQVTEIRSQFDQVADGDTQKIRALGDKLRTARYNQDVATARFGKYVAEQLPVNKGDALTSIYRASLLSSIRTQTKNMLSNSINLATNQIADVPAKAIDKVISFFTKQNTVSPTVRGTGKGFAEGIRRAGQYLKTGIDELDASDVAIEGRGRGELHFNNKVANAIFGKPTNLIYRVVGAGDKPIRYASEINGLYKVANTEAANLGLKGKARADFIERTVANPSEAQMQQAVLEGSNSVFASDNALSNAINRFMGDSKVANVVKPFIMPFVKVPTNVFFKQFNYTPAGAVKSIVSAIKDIGSNGGKLTARGQQNLARGLSKSVVGTATLFALGQALAQEGLYYGDYPDDANERKRWEAEGIKEHSIKIGDNYYQIGGLSVLGMPIDMGANYQANIEAGGDVLSSAGSAMMQSLNVVGDLPMASGIQEMSELLFGNGYGGSSDDIGNRALEFVVGKLTGFIPNLSSTIASATDTVERDVSGDDLLGQIMKKIPGLREMLPEKVDSYGRTVENGSFITGIFDPLYTSKDKSGNDLVINEVNRLAEDVDKTDLPDGMEADDLFVTPTYSIPKAVEAEDGTEVQLTTEQRNELERRLGNSVHEA